MGGPCGPPPTKMPNECCDSIDKLMKPDIYNNCKSQCGMDRCCEGECFAKGLNFLKDGKYDKATATSSVNKAFAANPEWLPVRNFF